MNSEGVIMMKKTCSIILAIILALSVISTASAAYTLPEKMERQLQVGSGLKGSLVIRTNADAEMNPLIHSIRNTMFEIRGIQYEGNQHYYIYQAGEKETLNALTEICRMNGRYYLRSDFLDGGCMLLPKMDHLINAALKAEGENPSVLPDLLRAVLGSKTENDLNMDSLERTVEMWINTFSTGSTVQSGEGSPRLSQTFNIPVNEVCNALTEVITLISSSENYMGWFRENLSKEQIDLYLNPNLGYYYAEAIEKLDMEGEIRFSRTVSTLGELITSSLYLPLDATKTGYSSVTFENNEKDKSVFLTGPNGVLYLQLPLETDLKNDDYENAEIRFARISNTGEGSKNVALRIAATRTSEKTEDTAENKIHEKETYILHIARDTENLPEGINPEKIEDFTDTDAEIVIHYSSKPQLSSPTTLEVSCEVTQGEYSFNLESELKTASPWVFTPFSIDGAKDAEGYTIKDLKDPGKIWIENAEQKLVRIPEMKTTEEINPETVEKDETAEESSENAEEAEADIHNEEGPEPVSMQNIEEVETAEPAGNAGSNP